MLAISKLHMCDTHKVYFLVLVLCDFLIGSEWMAKDEEQQQKHSNKSAYKTENGFMNLIFILFSNNPSSTKEEVHV